MAVPSESPFNPLSYEQTNNIDILLREAGDELGDMLQCSSIVRLTDNASLPRAITDVIGAITETAYPPDGSVAGNPDNSIAVAIRRGMTLGYLYGAELQRTFTTRTDQYEGYQRTCLGSLAIAMKKHGQGMSPERLFGQKTDMFDEIYRHLPLGEMGKYPGELDRTRQLFAYSTTHIAANGLCVLINRIQTSKPPISHLRIGMDAARLRLRSNSKPVFPVEIYGKLPETEA